MRKFKNYIFDLDGTLVNSSDEVLNCFSKAFEIAEYQIDKTRLTSNVIGPPLKEIIKLIAPELEDEEIIQTVIKAFRQTYDFDENDISVMYAGMYEYLQALKASGARLFMATFKPMIPTQRLVKKFGLEPLFEDIYTIDKFGGKITKDEMISHIISTYNLQKDETVMIGDAASDMTAAKKAGVFGLGVLWGYGNDKEPLMQAADCVVDKVSSLDFEVVEACKN